MAGNVSYVVLHRYPIGELVRISDDGRSQSTIATHVGGYGLAVDRQGDYLVARVSLLARVTPGGVVTTIAACPAGSQWMAVAVDSAGNYIVADNARHSIWRVSQDGNKVEKVATYPVSWQEELEDVSVIVDSAGDYLVAEDNNLRAHLWKVSPAGKVTPLPLQGDSMASASAIISDGSGGYFVLSYRDQTIFRVTAGGAATKFASVDGQNLTGLARNPLTGELVAAPNHDPTLRKISADGHSVTEFTSQGYADAVLAEVGR
jgi:hypothetical protein